MTISDCVLDCEDDSICVKTESPRGAEDVVNHQLHHQPHARADDAASGAAARRHLRHGSGHDQPGAAVTNVTVNDGVMTSIFLRIGKPRIKVERPTSIQIEEQIERL